MDFLTSFISVAIMVALAVPGFILRKRNMLPEKAVAALVTVLIYVSQPFLTISSFLSKEYDPRLLANMGVVLVLALVFHILIFLVARLVFGLFVAKKRDGESDEAYAERASGLDAQKRIAVITSFMGNVGFMGIPVMKALFPGSPEMLIYTAVFMVGFNIASWTIGVYTVTGDKRNISLRSAFLNPAVCSLVIALPLFFLKKYIPLAVLTPISDGVGYLAEMTLPLSMLILGIRLADANIKSLFSDIKIVVVCALKLVAAPVMCLGIMLLIRLVLPLSSAVINTILIVTAMPSAALTLSFAEKFDGDSMTAVRATLITTILSIITIPLMMLLCV